MEHNVVEARELLKDILDEFSQLDQVMISLDRIEEIYNLLDDFYSDDRKPISTEMIRAKVYCIDCLYLDNSCVYRCYHPENLFIHSTWLQATEYTRLPSELNAYNDCTWYKPEKKV